MNDKVRKYAVLPRAEEDIIVAKLIFAWVIALIALGDANGGEQIGLIAFMTLCYLLLCYAMRAVLKFCFGHIVFSEEGVEYKPLIGKSILIRWSDCTQIKLEYFDTGYRANSFYFFCFIKKNACYEKLNDLRKIPTPQNGIIIMTYIEFAWEDILRYAPSKLYKTAWQRRLNVD